MAAGQPNSGQEKSPRRGFRNPIRLRCACLDVRVDADLEAGLVLVLELHDAIDQRVNREIGAEADVSTRMPLGAALSNDDVAGNHLLTAELLYAAVLRIAVAPVAR